MVYDIDYVSQTTQPYIRIHQHITHHVLSPTLQIDRNVKIEPQRETYTGYRSILDNCSFKVGLVEGRAHIVTF